MATISLAIWVDSDGNAKVEANDGEAFNDLDDTLSVRKVNLTVEVPEPEEAQEIEVDVPAEKPESEATVKVALAAIPVLEAVQDAPEPATAKRWFGR